MGLGTSDDVQFDDLTLSGVLRTNEIDTQADLVWDDTNNTEVWNTSDYYINGAINIASNVYITDQLDVGESLTVGTTLDVTGNTTLDGTLTLSGSADFNSTMNLQGNLTTQANLQDDGYSPSWSGSNWQIQADGTAEFQELFVRGALTVYEFIAKQISTIGGSEILSIAQGKIDTVTPGSGAISFENTGNAPGISFKAGDLWICQVTSINQDKQSGGSGVIVKSVTGEVSFTTGNSIITSVTSGSLNDLAKGDLVVVYGNSGTDANAKARQAIMYRNVDRSVDSLIMRMQTGVDTFSKLQDEANTRVAFGDLGPKPGESIGYSGLSSETFGFFAGKNAEQHVLVTDTGIFFKNGLTVGAQLSSNVFKIGDNDNFLSFNTSNNDFEIKVDTFDLATSTLVIDSANNKIALGTSPSSITVSGTEAGFIATGSGEFKGYIDANNYLRLDSSGLDINAEDFNLQTTFIEISNGLQKTITSSVSYGDTLIFDGIYFDANNYIGYIDDFEGTGSDGYALRIGGNTSNFIEVNQGNGLAKINFDTFTLDATDASGGIKIDSDNELIQLEDASRVRTQVDVNNGTFSLTETVKYNANDETLILQSTPYQTGAIQITKGDSFYIDIEAELITFGTLGDGSSAYITVEVYGGTTSGSQTNLISSYIGDDLDTVGQRNIVRFSAYSYLYEYINVKVIVNSNDGDLNGQFRLKENVVVKSYDSQTRVSLDGVYVNSSDNQYARLTRSANELVGILKLSGLPTKKPQTTGIVYNDNGTLKIS